MQNPSAAATNRKGLALASPLHHAAQINDIEFLQKMMVNEPGSPFNPDQFYGEMEETILMFAAYNGSMECIKWLCEFPCDIYKLNKHKENCLHYAVKGKQVEAAKYLLNFARQEPLKSYSEKMHLQAKAERRKKQREDQLDAGIAEIDLVLSDEEVEPDFTDDDADKAEDSLMNQQSNFGMSPLMWGCKLGSKDIVGHLIERGAETKYTNRREEDGLHLAICKRNSEVGMALMEAGCDKDHVNAAGWTPLMIACNNGDLTTASSLLKRGCNVNYFSPKFCTALVIAKSRGHGKIVEVLMDSGAIADIEKIKENKRLQEEREAAEKLNKENRPATSEERRRQQAKIRVL